MSFIRASEISKSTAGNKVLDNISFEQEQFKKLCITGETGSGKTTLLKIIGGLITPDEGTVWFRNERIKRVPEEKLIPGHPEIAYLSQHFELPNYLRVEQVLEYANTLAPHQADKLFEVCRINHLLLRRTDQLSGGEKQRIAIARLLLGSPKLLLLDEPYSNLDMHHRQILKSVIQEISDQLQITCTMIAHDPVDTLSWPDEIIVLRDGKIIQQGTPLQLYRQPLTEYVGGLFGTYSMLPASIAQKITGNISLNEDQFLFLRPEDLELVNAAGSTCTSVVDERRFFGHYQEYDFRLSGIDITVKSENGLLAPGDEIGVRLKNPEPWIIRRE